MRHNAPAPAFCDIRDKFRIQMQYYTTKKIIGHKDVETILVRSSDNYELPAENFKQLLRSDVSIDNYDNESEIRQNFSKSKKTWINFKNKIIKLILFFSILKNSYNIINYIFN